MKIVVTVHQFLPDFSTGTEVIALSTVRELRRRGHTVTIVTGFPEAGRATDGGQIDRYVFEGIPVVRFRNSPGSTSGRRGVTERTYDNHEFRRAFEEVLFEHRPDLVHFLHLARLSASLVGACADRGIPTVFTATDFWPVCPYAQLRLEDNRLCAGPRNGAINCVRHFAARRAHAWNVVARAVAAAPDWAIRMAMRLPGRGVPVLSALVREAKALARRPEFLCRELNRVDRVIAPSRLMHRTLLAAGIAPKRLRLLAYGIGIVASKSASERGRARTLRLAFIGSMTEHKGVEVAAAAIRSLDSRLPVELSIYGSPGSGPAGEALQRRLEGECRREPRIRLCGPIANEQVPEVLRATDALVVPSVWVENTPLVVYEAFAMGCPVIGSEVEGIAEVVVHEGNGLLFPHGDSVALATCIMRLLEDRDLAQRLSVETRSPLSISEHVDRLEEIYSEAISARTSRARLRVATVAV